MTTQKYNRLIHEKSPYLLQHKDNPVHWYAWGEEAFEAAKKEDKPIFLSIGYSTCHWCHVMAHESFEKQEVADVLNEYFISIKLDREERPDVDEIYMTAIHAIGERGGWPLSMFLTPDLKPFYGGTYWPREYFIQILKRLAVLWKEEHQKIFESADSIFEFVKEQKTISLESTKYDEEVFHKFYHHSAMTFDSRWGGFGAAPKFPHTMQLSCLLRIHRRTNDPQALQKVTHTLEQMARGGIYDHLGGGFARYSTDERWLVPHFEKMLYDNALLAKTYLEAYQITKNEMFASITQEILDYILRDMKHPEGGFYCAEDADSEGEEGKFYVWSFEELKKLLKDEEFEIFSKVYGITEEGNFSVKEHSGHQTNILSLQENYGWEDKKNLLLQSAHKQLFDAREKRIHPHKDDKILTAWNGLMISAMTLGFQVLGERRYLTAAEKAVEFIQSKLWKSPHPPFDKGGLGRDLSTPKLLARYRDGEGRFEGTLDDYAYLIAALIDLYECQFDDKYLKWTLELQEQQDSLFWDSKEGGFFFTDGSDPHLLVRSKEGIDGALPNSNAVSALNLLRLYHLTYEEHYLEEVKKIFNTFSKIISEHPYLCAQMLIAYDFFTDSSKEIAIIRLKTEEADSPLNRFLKMLHESFCPNKVMAINKNHDLFPELLKGKTALEGKTTFYLCEDKRCEKPTTDPELALKNILEYRSYKLN